MKSKLLEITVQAVLVDEDDAGNVIGKHPLNPVTFPGLTIQTNLASHLAAIHKLCQERSEGQSPNRAARRSQKRRTK